MISQKMFTFKIHIIFILYMTSEKIRFYLNYWKNFFGAEKLASNFLSYYWLISLCNLDYNPFWYKDYNHQNSFSVLFWNSNLHSLLLSPTSEYNLFYNPNTFRRKDINYHHLNKLYIYHILIKDLKMFQYKHYFYHLINKFIIILSWPATIATYN